LWGILFPCHKINLQTGKSILHQFEGLHKLWDTPARLSGLGLFRIFLRFLLAHVPMPAAAFVSSRLPAASVLWRCCNPAEAQKLAGL
ncbi:MAG: hypothetical protein KHX22_05295, partial [Clostridiales bacterium]|nr:hypothetical protein [Clostridiales bacterium]